MKSMKQHLQPEHACGESSPLRAATNAGCFVCGTKNPRGMQIHFRLQRTGEVEAQWTPSPDLEGFQGIIHGGVVSTVLDEAMSKAVASLPCEALTAELRVRFREPVRTGQCMRIQGWVCHRSKRRVATEATLVNLHGVECAHAWAVFLQVPGGSSAP
jgi:acyl-coenzyme A thioesterase PaaI-like protein